MSAPAPGLPFRIYAGLTAALAPLIGASVRRKMAAAGVQAVRIEERFGSATEARDPGRLIWFHAVSVGESLSILGLIHELHARDDALRFLITSVSATSARLVAERMPPNTVHQFAPLDTPRAVAAFLDHWRPDLAVFVESELWPRLIAECDRRGIPLALVNARLSERSLGRWRRFPKTARWILERFEIIISQTEDTKNNILKIIGSKNDIFVSGDLKAASDRLPVDATLLDDLKTSLRKRNVWVAASTHPGEEEIVADAHDAGRFLILAPRHPERGDGIAALLREKGWAVAQRSKGEEISEATQIYLADTLGEMGIWYALSDVVFLGGSLTEIGGHNPFEPAQFSDAVLFGPHVTNFRQTYDEMRAQGAAREVRDAESLRTALADLDDPETRAAMREAAHGFAQSRAEIRVRVADRIMPLLDPAA